MLLLTSDTDTSGRPVRYMWDIRTPGNGQGERVRTTRKTSIATLAQLMTALARLNDVALKNKQNRVAAYASSGFASSNAYADELAYRAERKRRLLQKARDREFMARQTDTSAFHHADKR